MTGLERIIQQIESGAEEEAVVILQQAKADADEILDAARREAKQKSDAIISAGETSYANAVSLAESAVHLERQNKLLRLKQKLIEETVREALEQLCAMPLVEYFGVIKKLAVRYALPKAGTLYLCANDLRRCPKTLEAELNELIREKGGTLTLSDETRPIDGGFVLQYGGVEENCSFKALFEAKQDRLQDAVSSVLFAE